MDAIERAINSLGRISLLAQLRDLVSVALQVDRRQCGNCDHWMKKSRCPLEKSSMTGFSTGPSSRHPACGKFQITQSTLDLKAQRIREAVEFAVEHDLPVPFAGQVAKEG